MSQTNFNEQSFPKGPITTVQGRCMCLKGDDIDTDRIIPARFLKCVSFDFLGDKVFIDDRFEGKGNHPFDQDINKGASILLVNKNFGCGSSREHAPQALMRWGIRAIIGESFAEIFYGNCLSLGVTCATLPAKEINSLMNATKSNPSQKFNLSLLTKILKGKENTWNINIEKATYEMLVSGRWDIANTLLSEGSKIKSIKQKLPYLNNFKNI